MRKLALAALCVIACAASASAQGAAPVPEIDGGSLAAALALVGGGIFMLRARSRSK